jgi:hypothetical protein
VQFVVAEELQLGETQDAAQGVAGEESGLQEELNGVLENDREMNARAEQAKAGADASGLELARIMRSYSEANHLEDRRVAHERDALLQTLQRELDAANMAEENLDREMKRVSSLEFVRSCDILRRSGVVCGGVLCCTCVEVLYCV